MGAGSNHEKQKMDTKRQKCRGWIGIDTLMAADLLRTINGLKLQLNHLDKPSRLRPLWVCGTVQPEGRGRYQFAAQLHAFHSLIPLWELKRTHIRKLLVVRVQDFEVVYRWRWGLKVPPPSKPVADIVADLTSVLAPLVYGEFEAVKAQEFVSQPDTPQEVARGFIADVVPV